VRSIFILAFFGASALYSQEFTRGVGAYPGAPSENFSPTLQPGGSGGLARPTGEIRGTAALRTPARSRFYRLVFFNARPLNWTISGVYFFRGGSRVQIGGPYSFTSAWKSTGAGEEWVYVDLGAQSAVEGVKLSWIARAQAGSLQLSNDAQSWTDVHSLDTAEIKLPQPVQARYVRVLMTKPESPQGYVLSELEVIGRGGVVPAPQAAAPLTGRKLMLAGGPWKVERESEVRAAGPALSTPGFPDAAWLPATVPGTVLASYLNAGAIANPDFSDNQNMVSDSYFYSGFWYRTEFVSPVPAAGQHIWLNFNGVNWKADVWFNGQQLGRIEGGYMRRQFDVTSKLRPGA
jgi:hypothetical protein